MVTDFIWHFKKSLVLLISTIFNRPPLSPQCISFCFMFPLLAFYTSVFYCHSLESPSSWMHSIFLTSTIIPNEVNIFKDSKIMSIKERKHANFCLSEPELHHSRWLFLPLSVNFIILLFLFCFFTKTTK